LIRKVKLARLRWRAGEVLDADEDVASMKDPRGGSPMDRTVVICNTSPNGSIYRRRRSPTS
jgi:hypothetical protein